MRKPTSFLIGWGAAMAVLAAYTTALFQVPPIHFSNRAFRFFPVPFGPFWGEWLAIGFVVAIAGGHISRALNPASDSDVATRTIASRLGQLVFGATLLASPCLVRWTAQWIAGQIAG